MLTTWYINAHSKCLKCYFYFQRLALENVQQNSDSAKYTPFVVNVPGENIQAPEGQTVQYSTYLSTVKNQISCAKEIHDLLMESAKKLSDVWWDKWRQYKSGTCHNYVGDNNKDSSTYWYFQNQIDVMFQEFGADISGYQCMCAHVKCVLTDTKAVHVIL